MRQIRVTLECGRPHSNTREWFSTILLLSEEEIAHDEHIAIAKYRARIQGYVEPFEVFQPTVARAAVSEERAVPADDVTGTDSESPRLAAHRAPRETSHPDGHSTHAGSRALPSTRR